MICLLARIYTQTDYQTRYPFFAKLVLDGWSVSSINWASGGSNAPVNQLVRTKVQVNQSLCANPPGNQIDDAIGGFHVTQVSLIITQVKNKITYHSINWVKKLKYVPKSRGCAIFRLRVIRQKVSLKIIVFSMEKPCWSPSEGLQHGGRKPVKTSGVYFGSLKTFILSVKLEDIRIGTFFQHIGYSELETIRRIDIFVHVTCYPETMPMSRIVQKSCSIFKTKWSAELKTGQQIYV